jgi:membrane protease YdiL (CAAX protease family)
MSLEPVLRRHPVRSFFALTYAISWGGILIVMAASDFDLLDQRPLDTGFIFVLMLLGPSLSGLALTALLQGRQGLRQFGASLVHWRVGIRWVLFAMLTMPLLLIAVLWPLGAFADSAFMPRFQWPMFALGLIAGGFEEIGWTGFAAPRLLEGRRPFVAGLLIGLAWALWHALVDFRQNVHVMGAIWWLEFGVLYLAALTAYRVLMTWVYANTRSLPLAMLMHASYTGWLLVLYPATSFGQGLVWQSGFAIALWLAVAMSKLRGCQPRHFSERREQV